MEILPRALIDIEEPRDTAREKAGSITSDSGRITGTKNARETPLENG